MHAQNDLNLRILRTFEGTFSLGATQITLTNSTIIINHIYVVVVVVVVGVVVVVVVGVVVVVVGVVVVLDVVVSGEQSQPNSGQLPLAHCLVHQSSIPA